MAEINWTVSIIFQYYEEDEFFFKSLKDDIELQTPDNHQRVKYFLLKHQEVEKIATAFAIDDNHQLEKRVAPFNIADSTKPFEAAAFYTNFDLAENMWIEFLQNAAQFEDANHFVMTVGHGDGFGFTTEAGLPDSFRDDDFLKVFRNVQRILSMNVINSTRAAAQLRQFKNINKRSLLLADAISRDTVPIEKFGMVPIAFLSSAIKRAFKQQRLSILYLGNCFVQTIENGFLLREQTRFLCASEGMYYPPGTDFLQLFSQMGSSPLESNSEVILEKICSGINQKLKEQRILDFFQTKESDLLTIEQTFCFSVNSLEKYEQLKGLVSDIGQLFIDNRETMYDLITNIRNDSTKCLDVFDNPLGIIDLSNFCKKLSAENNLPPVVKSRLDSLIGFIETSQPSVIASKRFPDACFKPATPGGKAIFPTGISIFFPRMKPGVETNQYLKLFFDNFYTDEKYITSFLSGNKWRDFVIDYYTARRPSLIQRFRTFINKLF